MIIFFCVPFCLLLFFPNSNCFSVEVLFLVDVDCSTEINLFALLIFLYNFYYKNASIIIKKLFFTQNQDFPLPLHLSHNYKPWYDYISSVLNL